MLHHLSLKLFRCSVTTSAVAKLGHTDTPRSVGKLPCEVVVVGRIVLASIVVGRGLYCLQLSD